VAEYPLTVVTPERTVFEGPVSEIIVRGIDGELGVLAHHIPLITALKPCVLRVMEPNGGRWHLAIGGGFLEVGSSGTVVLADTAERPEEIDVRRAEEARQRALSRLEKPGPDIDIERAKAALARAEARLLAAQERRD
jgi:F-type H+-transporting ATPase subunit epsilon